ncbi:class I SAM-dependent methyltransferase [Herbaspirillum sp. RTI4]|uniref:class I SAM-dependent methyltransferase n=1 Tax=Herbaspirillum sp. RTI4 TaxID=3048640 RepID=UPI002B23616E|nr:class I SAM-dependent methyltransferase [Herbaspirillum sp. RTI4]
MSVDQQLLFCPACGHGQLETLIAPNVLYGSNYCFRTSTSTSARKGTEFFLSVINEVAPERQFRCVLDLGCNDLFLLDLLKDRADFRVGIDPVWENRESDREDQSIQIFGMNFEDVDLQQLPAKPDLIVCRHTLEHIIDPCRVVKALMDIAADDAVFIFEVPGFDGLIQRFRFDQIFHQHAQYFTLASFLKLLEKTGGRHLLHRYNFHDWCGMAVAFVKGPADICKDVKHWTQTEIISRYTNFQKQMSITRELLDFHTGLPLYGYGAAQTLPILGYHMNTDFGQLIAVIDDDDEKDGIGYWNLPVKVVPARKVGDLHDAAVLITAIDNVQPIMKKLLTNRPRHILVPLNII